MIFKDFFEDFSRIFKEYFKNISPKAVKQVGVVHVILFAPKCFHALGLVSHKVLNSWAKSLNNKTCLNWIFLNCCNFFETQISKVSSHFPIWSSKEWSRVKLTIWLLTIKTWEMKFKIFLIIMCYMFLEMFKCYFQTLKDFQLEFFCRTYEPTKLWNL